MGPTIVFNHQIDDTVKTKVGIEGRVSSLCFDDGGLVYAVEWVNTQGEVKSRWFRPGEIVGPTEAEG